MIDFIGHLQTIHHLVTQVGTRMRPKTLPSAAKLEWKTGNSFTKRDGRKYFWKR